MSDENSARFFPRSVGLCRLIEELQLQVPVPATRSEIVAGARKTVAADGKILEQYPRNYAPKEPFGDLRFALRYEPIALDVYLAIFQSIDTHQLEEWIRSEPTGIFTRRAWYLYELLMEKQLDVPDVIPSGYIDLLDPKIHLTGPRRLVRRQRINDNLLGTGKYSPLVRRTDALTSFMDKGLVEEANAIVKSCDPAILARAVHYLFTKETKSSFAIEGEEPSKDRTERFVAALMKTSGFDATSKDAFVQLQNAIVDPRYAQKNWRTAQNFVSQTLPDYSEDVHFVCPKPEDVPSLMDAWMEMVRRLKLPEGVDPVVAAAVAAFGFVFLHPFDDGNGRIHRFLVHHILSKLGFTPQGILFPVSAAMLRDRLAYDQVLEGFSGSIMPFIQYDLDLEHGMTVKNDTALLYRYFDATAEAEYLYRCIEETIYRDLRDEIGFLAVFDAALRATLNIVDMPNRRAALLVRLILQNKGKLSKGKRTSFAEVTDQEVDQIETAVWGVWQESQQENPSEKS
ncbi:Fic family protein [Telmatobacter bradus]|uniref:Fic family protein n=1 Tax=Telmatobacter bradus TaxID=474953 RepID=UPI003B431DD5